MAMLATPPNCFTTLHKADLAALRDAFKRPKEQSIPHPEHYIAPKPEGQQDRGLNYNMQPGADANIPVVSCGDTDWSVPARFIPFRLAPIFRTHMQKVGQFCRRPEDHVDLARPDHGPIDKSLQRFEWDVTKLFTVRDLDPTTPPWPSISDPVAAVRLPENVQADYAVFPLSYTPFSSVRNGKEGQKCSELVKGDYGLTYAGPALGQYDRDGQSAEAVFLPDRVAEAAFYQAVAYVMFLGIPIVFESSDAGQHPEVFARTFVRHLVGVYRRYPSLIRLIQKEQLTLLLKIDNFPTTRLHELVKRWRHAMLECCPEREIEVRYFPMLGGDDFKRFIAPLRFCRGGAKMAETAIPGCIPRGFIDLGPDRIQWAYRSIEFLEHARAISRMRIWEQNWRQLKLCTFVDVGQISSTMAIASQVSGALFCDGPPGSVKMQVFSDMAANYGQWTGVVLKTRDPNSVMANALVFAVAFAMSSVVVIPTGLPIDALIRPIRMALERADQLLLSPGYLIMDPFLPKSVILFSQDGTRPMEEIVAVELLKNLFEELGPNRPEPQKIKVIPTAEPHEVVQTISTLSCENSLERARLADFIVGFGVVNDYAEYLGLDVE